MSTATSSSKFLTSLAAVVSALGLAGAAAAAGQAMPDTENGRYALSTTPDGVLRLDTRTGAVSTCGNSGAGWACYAVPDERAALDAEIGRLQADNEKLKAELASREPTVPGKIEEPLPKSELDEEGRAEGSRRRTQDRNSAAERSRHGSHDVVPGARLAAVDRNGQPGAEGRQRRDLRSRRPGEGRGPYSAASQVRAVEVDTFCEPLTTVVVGPGLRRDDKRRDNT